MDGSLVASSSPCAYSVGNCLLEYLQLHSPTSILTLMNLLCWDLVNILQLETLFVLGDEERMDS